MATSIRVLDRAAAGPPMAISLRSTRELRTGTWRTVRPQYVQPASPAIWTAPPAPTCDACWRWPPRATSRARGAPSASAIPFPASAAASAITRARRPAIARRSMRRSPSTSSSARWPTRRARAHLGPDAVGASRARPTGRGGGRGARGPQLRVPPGTRRPPRHRLRRDARGPAACCATASPPIACRGRSSTPRNRAAAPAGRPLRRPRAVAQRAGRSGVVRRDVRRRSACSGRRPPDVPGDDAAGRPLGPRLPARGEHDGRPAAVRPGRGHRRRQHGARCGALGPAPRRRARHRLSPRARGHAGAPRRDRAGGGRGHPLHLPRGARALHRHGGRPHRGRVPAHASGRPGRERPLPAGTHSRRHVRAARLARPHGHRRGGRARRRSADLLDAHRRRLARRSHRAHGVRPLRRRRRGDRRGHRRRRDRVRTPRGRGHRWRTSRGTRSRSRRPGRTARRPST